MAMAAVGVSVATAALKPLVEKLAAALGKKYQRFKGVRGEIKSLTEELDAMHAFLLKMSEEVENPDEQDKLWMKEVRELSYDMEDNLDEFMIRVDGDSADPHGFMDKCKNTVSSLKDRWKIAKKIEKLKIQVKKVGDRNQRYRNPGTIMNISNKSVDPRALTIFEDASKMLVGIDQPKDELIKLLERKECQSKTKVVSIVGSGGLGKTTLAYQVYQELFPPKEKVSQKVNRQFDCGAFLSVGRSPDMMNILRIILSKVSDQPYGNTEAGSIEMLIGDIRKYLGDKRYLIVIDDVWKEETWKTIDYALFRNNKHSRIIATTRMLDVAEACCSSECDVVHKMKPLKYEDSERLFLNRLFGSEGQCPPNLTDISKKILGKCDGIPLAVISISGLLANKPKSEYEWNRVHNSIGRGLGKNKNPDAQRMMQILSLSYFDLPLDLKSCLLYLSIFPEESVIAKGRIVRRWIAEGFIEEEEGNTRYELGEWCFNELINRSLIQARKTNMHGEVTACQVHDTILDFIVLKSEEENFVTLFGDGYQMPTPRSKVRRLSLLRGSKERVSKLTEKFSDIRSVTVFDYSMDLPSCTEFHFLRVLDLQGCRQVDSGHLAAIGGLFQLKYLNLYETGVCELPEEIRKLKYLEALELKKSKITTLPAFIAELQRLVYLGVDKGVTIPDGAGSMVALEDLDCVDISKNSIEFIRELGQLKNLRKVSFFISPANCSDAKKFEMADILVFGRLPALVFLQLVAHEWFEATRLTVRGCDGFPCLREFVFGCAVPVMFEVGAMPNLEKLTLMFNFFSLKIGQLLVSNGDLPFGIHYLINLKSLHSVVGYWYGKKVVVEEWVREKIVQIEKKGFSPGKEMAANMIYTLAIATTSLLEAKLRQYPIGAASAGERAVHNHSKFPKLKLSQGVSWRCDVKEECYPDGPMFGIRNIMSRFLHCEEPQVLAIKDKVRFSTLIRTMLEDTSISLRLIQDNAYTATIAFVKERICSVLKNNGNITSILKEYQLNLKNLFEEEDSDRFGIPHHFRPTRHFGSEFGIDRRHFRTLLNSELTEQDFENKGKVPRSKSYFKNSSRRRLPLRLRKRVKCLKIAQIQGRYKTARLQRRRC